ncbi:MAG TPA: LemA family protein [Chryseolinea sp.]|nr:LemA family protein [Chryseolinea sp.]
MRIYLPGLLAFFCALSLLSCNSAYDSNADLSFSKEDSVTDHYLAYQDSLLLSWNVMINDDNQKLKAMHNLLHELMATSHEDHEELDSFEEQLDQLVRLRYTQKSMGNSDVIEEYDFATTTLVRELISMAESRTEFGYNQNLQRLVDDIRLADERVSNYREEYDDIVANYNSFVEHNRQYLKEVNIDSLEKRHLFQMVSVE